MAGGVTEGVAAGRGALGGELPIFDGHNDALLCLTRRTRRTRPARRDQPTRDGRDAVRAFLEGGEEGHLDLPRARAGGFAGGLFAVFVPAPGRPRTPQEEGFRRTADGYEMPLAPAVPLGYAQRRALGMMATLFRLEAASVGQVRVVRTVDEIVACLGAGRLAAVLHFEGADAIDPDLDALEVFYRAGLRSLGLVWSRPNAFGCGVPFAFPRSPDAGPGLTDAGRALVRACAGLGIVVDVSHLNERGFWDVAALGAGPLVATHSGAHALCPVARNLTDRQLAAIRDSDGMVGVVFDVSMLTADSALDPEAPLEEIVRHVDYLVGRLGLERVGFGSDFDGATIPRVLGDARGLPLLVAALRRHGFDEAALRRLTHQNWLRLLRQVWRA